MPAGRICRSCSSIIPSGTYKGCCPTCSRTADQARGTKTERGYGSTVYPTPLGTMTYDQCRSRYQRLLNQGATITCHRCDDPIDPEHWHLGHNDDRDRLEGPECPPCNTSDAGRRGGGGRGRPASSDPSRW